MSQSKAWKTAERAWGAFLGGKRVPVTGRARGDAPDVGPAEEGQHWPWSVDAHTHRNGAGASRSQGRADTHRLHNSPRSRQKRQ